MASLRLAGPRRRLRARVRGAQAAARHPAAAVGAHRGADRVGDVGLARRAAVMVGVGVRVLRRPDHLGERCRRCCSPSWSGWPASPRSAWPSWPIAPTPGAAQAFSNGGLILLAFISGIFIVQLPDWMDRVGWFFPLKHFVDPVADGFNPFLDGQRPVLGRPRGHGGLGDRRRRPRLRFFSGSRVRRAGSASSTRARRTRTRHGRRRGERAALVASTVRSLTPPCRTRATHALGALVLGQIRYATHRCSCATRCRSSSPSSSRSCCWSSSPRSTAARSWGGLPLPQYLAAAFAVYGVAVMAYVNLSGAIVDERVPQDPQAAARHAAAAVGLPGRADRCAARAGADDRRCSSSASAPLFFGVRVGTAGAAADDWPCSSPIIGVAAAWACCSPRWSTRTSR